LVEFTSVLAVLDRIPLIRAFWRWLWERRLEVSWGPPVWNAGPDPEMKITLGIEDTPGISVNFAPFLLTMFTLRLVNHRTDRMERVIGGCLAIKKRRLFLWRETLATAPIYQRGRSPVQPLLSDVPLPPISPPTEIQCMVQETFDRSLRQTLPRKSEIWLELELVGPVRRFRRKVSDLWRVAQA